MQLCTYVVSFVLDKNKELLDELNAIKWPDKEDFKGAIQGLLRVQYTYLLQIEELAKGIDIKPNKKARLIVCSFNFSLENSDKIGFDFICIKFKKS